MKCIVDGCSCKQHASGKGYCRKHYDQFRAFGYVTLDTPKNRIEKDEDGLVLIIHKHGRDVARVRFDECDIDLIRGHVWSLNGNGYVRTFDGHSPKYLHRMILQYEGSNDVDHIDHDRLNNRRDNLRIVEHWVNCGNREYIGARHTGRNLSKPWVASVKCNGRVLFYKYFETEAEARDAVISFKRDAGLIV